MNGGGVIDIRTGRPMVTRRGLLRGILAAGVAPAIVPLQGLADGGLRRGLGARIAAMGGGVGELDYITRGLVAVFDYRTNEVGSTRFADRNGNYTLYPKQDIYRILSDGYGRPVARGNLCDEHLDSSLIDACGANLTCEVVFRDRTDDADTLVIKILTSSSDRGKGDLRTKCGSFGSFCGLLSVSGWNIPAVVNRVYINQTEHFNSFTITSQQTALSMYVNGKWTVNGTGADENISAIYFTDAKSYACIRFYSVPLTADEISHNHKVDQLNFNCV